MEDYVVCNYYSYMVIYARNIIREISLMKYSNVFKNRLNCLTSDDVFKDLVGEEPSERTPNWLRDRSPTVKKCVTGGLVATSAAATSLVYILTQN